MTATQFFFKQAGYSWIPGAETASQGRLRGAKQLAKAESNGLGLLDFEWLPEDEPGEHGQQQWTCLCRDAQHNVVESLSGIDFGGDGTPWGQPYKRVIEAELAFKYFSKE